jgi:glutaredoxin
MGSSLGGDFVSKALWAALLLALVAAAFAACSRGRSHAAPAATAAPEADALAVKDDTSGLLLTWIDDKGDFHVETKVADVPLMGRDAVRVVDPAHEDGAHADTVAIVDLRQARPDGTYPVRTMTRVDFEALAVARREKAGPTLASAAASASAAAAAAGAAASGSSASTAGSPNAALRPAVIIYGAEWCGACHDAAHYLRRKGIAYVEKDIEKDPVAAREMQQKLAKNGLRAGSIPVIDVRGRVMVGFNAAEIEGALGTL